MTAISTHYKAILKKVDAELKISYKGGRFYRVERTKGKLTDEAIKHLGKIVPPNEKAIPEFSKKWPHVAYQALQKKKSDSRYSAFLSGWFSFFRNRNGIEPKFTGADGNALKQIIKYLTEVSGSETEALQLWNGILKSWSKLDDFHQRNTDLKYINSNLNKIIQNVKQLNKNGISDDYLRSVVDDLRA